MSHRECALQGVVYSMRCTVSDDLYIGETEKPARERFAEHYRDAKMRDVRTAWGSHYIDHRESATTSPEFAPFHKAQIFGRQSSLPTGSDRDRKTWTGGESRQWLAINGLTCSMLLMIIVLMSTGFTA